MLESNKQKTACSSFFLVLARALFIKNSIQNNVDLFHFF